MTGARIALAVLSAGMMIGPSIVAASMLLGLAGAAELPVRPLASPAEAPDRWLLAFVDVETTGLVPGYHEMIDIGIIMTDLEGVEAGRIFHRIQPRRPERTSPQAQAVNAFDPDRWRELGASSPAEAVAAIRKFHQQTAGDRRVMLVAFNSHFDAAFLDHLFRDAGASWRDLYHYFILDLPSMAWSLGLRQLDGSSLAHELDVDDEPRVPEEHTGITGADLNLRIYRALLEVRKALAESSANGSSH